MMRSIVASVLVLGAVVAPVFSETIHGLVMVTRHGDRTSKFYKGYRMTSLGAAQVLSSGEFYRSRYIEEGAPRQILDISPDEYKPSQLWVSAPDQDILLQTATNFLQGLYPPLGELNRELAIERLNNETEIIGPLNGYQFVQVHGESEEEPDTIWIKGDDECPGFVAASKTYRKSEEYMKNLESSREFYSQFADELAQSLPAANVSYAHAFDVFDLLNVGKIHNASVSDLPDEDLDQLRYYADAAELAASYNRTQPARSIGGMALAGGILRQLERTVSTQAKLKMSLMAGSYDNMLSFFGLTNLTETDNNFRGLPDYASTMSFELFTEDDMTAFPSNTDDLQVRFFFRNATVGEPTAWPLFGQSEDSLPYSEFKTVLGARAINDVGEWCSMCESEAEFCTIDSIQSASGTSSTTAPSTSTSGKSGLTNAQAGVIGAMTTLAVVAIVAALAFLLMRRKKASTPLRPMVEKRGSDSDTSGIAA